MRSTICAAHARASSVADGRHEKIIFRLGVSDTPTLFVGPMMPRSLVCGGIVVRAVAEPFDAGCHAGGLTRSSYGPSPRRTNATETLCGPAFTMIGGVRYK